MFYKLDEYDEKYYQIYTRRRDVDWAAIPTFSWIKNKLELCREDVLLDAGSGDGCFLKFLCNDLKISGFGVDISDSAISLAQKNAPQFQYTKADLVSLPFPNGYFTKIVCYNVIEHIVDQDGAMCELKRVLKPGGIIVLGTNIRDSLCWWLYQRIIGEHTHTREFNFNEFSRFVARYFDVTEIIKSSGVFRPIKPLRFVFHHILMGDVLIKGEKSNVPLVHSNQQA